MIFRTEIGNLNFPFKLSYDNKISFIGSCFSDNIGEKLKGLGFDVLSNPFGVVYNPYSAYKQLRRIIDLKIPADSEYKQKGELRFSENTDADKEIKLKLEEIKKAPRVYARRLSDLRLPKHHLGIRLPMARDTKIMLFVTL